MVAVRYLRNAAHVLRCNSTANEALGVATDAFELTTGTDAPRARATCAGMVGSIYMQLGDNGAASDWLTRRDAAYNPADNTILDSNWWSYRAELAIRLNDTETAEIAVARCIESAAQGQSPRGMIRAHSLAAQLFRRKGEIMPLKLLEPFLGCYELTKLSSLQDYSVESLLLALESAGRNEDATHLAEEYVSKFRRDVSPLSVPLSDVIHSLKQT
jgi:hypothetical protein